MKEVNVKTLKRLCRRTMVFMTVFSMVIGYFVLPVHAEEENVPKIAGEVIFPFHAVKPEESDIRSLIEMNPGKINVIFDCFDDMNTALKDIETISFSWKIGDTVYTSPCADSGCDSQTYEFVDKFNTLFIDGALLLQDLLISVEAANGIINPDAGFADYYVSQEEYEVIYKELQKLQLNIKIEWTDGSSCSQKASAVAATTKQLEDFYETSKAVVINLADSKTINDTDFYMLENAITHVNDSRVYTNKYYVDVESTDDIILPINNLSIDAILTQLKIGSHIVYNTSAGVLMPEKYSIANDSETEAIDVYRFTYEDIYDGENTTISMTVSESHPEDLVYGLRNKQFWLDDDNGGHLMSVASFCMEASDGAVRYLPEILNNKLDDLIYMIENGVMVDSVPKKYLDGTVIPNTADDTDCRFHIVFNTDSGNMDEFKQLLNEPAEPDVRYELGRMICLEEDELKEDICFWKLSNSGNYAQTKVGGENNYVYEYRFIPLDYVDGFSQTNIKYIEYTAYNYDTFEYIKATAEACGITINESESMIPDFENIVLSDISVKDYYRFSKTNEIYYEPWKDSTILQRKSEEVTQIISPKEANIEYGEATYKDNQVMIPLQSVSELEKGVVYNVTAQILTNDMDYLITTQNDKRTYDVIRYYNGDLVRTYMHTKADGKQLWYTEYKWGEIVKASRPAVSKNLNYDETANTLSWERPDDEGLGISGNMPQTDDYVYIQSYTANIYDKKHELVYTKTIENNCDEQQSIVLPYDLINRYKTYTCEVFSTNALGNSDPVTYIIEAVPVPAVTISLTPDKNNYLKKEMVTYRIVVKNTGNVPLTNLIISESLEGMFEEDDAISISGNTAVLSNLQENESYTLFYCVKAGDAEVDYHITNHIEAVTDEGALAEADSIVSVLNPSISITKTPDKSNYQSNEIITYKEVVTNTSDFELTNLTITENLKGTFLPDENVNINESVAVLDTLAAGESYTFFYRVSIADIEILEDNLINSTVRVVTDEDVDSEDTKTVQVIHPAVSIVGMPEKEVYYYNKNEVVKYHITVENTGDCDLTNLVITEGLMGEFEADSSISIEGNVAAIPNLAINESFELIYYVEADNVINEEQTELINNIAVQTNEGAVADTAISVRIITPKEPTTEEPTTEEPTTEEPTTEEPTPEEPTTEEPTPEEPITEEPTPEEPITEEPTPEEPTTEEATPVLETTSSEQSQVTTPKTMDNTDVALYVLLVIASLFCIPLVVYKRKNQ